MFAGIFFVGLALIVVGFCLCLADFLLLLWVVSHVVA